MPAFATTLKSIGRRMSALVKMLIGLDRPHLYRPEMHYMRGPGPKWHARHGGTGQRPAMQRSSTTR